MVVAHEQVLSLNHFVQHLTSQALNCQLEYHEYLLLLLLVLVANLDHIPKMKAVLN